MLENTKRKFPPWLRVPFSSAPQFQKTVGVIADLQLNTICEEGACPNKAECFSHGVATFMLLGRTCTRNCKYCNVSPGKPRPIDGSEPLRVAEAVRRLGLSYVVITSVNRDDLPDGGASQFIQTIQEIKRIQPFCNIEILIPDFKGNKKVLENIATLPIEVLSHNIETVQEIFPRIRPQGNYFLSLALLKKMKQSNPFLKTKSGFMLGLGETAEQIERVLADLRNQRCDFVTIGQYLPPTPQHYPLSRYYSPEEFQFWKENALQKGFLHVEAGPLVRSSYRADRLIAYATPPLRTDQCEVKKFA
ncbi:MAG TPA: lipoyl synthase [Candidatus Nanoarchaeia archaeon]|nr:lipoyl synthase [Candidatus Nanoarchaeia archaeon]